MWCHEIFCILFTFWLFLQWGHFFYLKSIKFQYDHTFLSLQRKEEKFLHSKRIVYPRSKVLKYKSRGLLVQPTVDCVFLAYFDQKKVHLTAKNYCFLTFLFINFLVWMLQYTETLILYFLPITTWKKHLQK